MKHIRIVFSTTILILIISSSCHCIAQIRPSKREILKAMTTANNYFMTKWPDPVKDVVLPSGKVHKSNIWTRGTYYTGLMSLYRTNHDSRVLEYAVDWGEKHKWGLNRGVTTRNANDHCAGQTYIELYLLDTTKQERLTTIKESIDLIITSGRIDDWNWVDASYMAMPVFAKLGALTGENVYYDRMYTMFMAMKNSIGGGLFNSKDGLWWRDADFVQPYKEPNGQNCYWSRGNGWVVGALVRSLQVMPKDAPNRDEYLNVLMQMCEALLKVQREDGMWNVSLHDPSHFGGKEVTGTAFFIYGMAWGVNNGFLDAEKYTPAIYKAWKTIVKDCLHPDGFLGFIQGTGKEPKDSQPVTYNSIPDFEDYGLGAFLLAGSEIFKMK